MKKKLLNKEEQLFQDKLNQLDYEYNPSDWEALQDRLPNSGNKTWSSSKSIVGIAAAGIVLVSSLYYFTQDDQVIDQQVEKTHFVEKAEEKPNEASVTKVEEITSEDQKADQQTTSAKENEIISSEEVAADKNNIEDQEVDIKADKTGHQENTDQLAESSIESKPKTLETSIQDEIKSFNVELPNKVCSDQIHVLMMETSELIPEGYYMHWNFDQNGQKSDSEDATHLSAVIKNENDKIVKTIEKKVEIVDISKYSIDYTYEDNKDPYTDLMVEFKAKDATYSSFKWIGENGELLGEGKEFNYSFKDQGVYDVELIAETAEGCEVSNSKPVFVQNDFDPLAPNAFSPNQDGNNDIFIPEAFKLRDDRFKMEIHSLQGELIYRTMSTTEGWNGQMNNNGQAMPEGIYVWVVEINNDSGAQKRYVGNLRLMRN